MTLTWHGLVTCFVLVVMELSTRRVRLAGITLHTTGAFMTRCTGRLTDTFEDSLQGKRCLLHDRDKKLVHGFNGTLYASGVERVVSPRANSTSQCLLRAVRALELSSCTFEHARKTHTTSHGARTPYLLPFIIYNYILLKILFNNIHGR